jgi:hypothetical protein
MASSSVIQTHAGLPEEEEGFHGVNACSAPVTWCKLKQHCNGACK